MRYKKQTKHDPTEKQNIHNINEQCNHIPYKAQQQQRKITINKPAPPQTANASRTVNTTLHTPMRQRSTTLNNAMQTEIHKTTTHITDAIQYKHNHQHIMTQYKHTTNNTVHNAQTIRKRIVRTDNQMTHTYNERKKH